MSAGDGGAVEDESSGGALTISESTFSSNTACESSPSSFDPTEDGDGGAIDSSDGGVVTIDSSTIAGNTSPDDGGGVAYFAAILLLEGRVRTAPALPELSVVNSTVTGNTTTDEGGGIYAEAPTTISFSTINSNNSIDGGGGNLATGLSGGPITLDDTIVTAGEGDGDIPENCFGGNFVSNGHNLFDDGGTDCGAPGTGDLTNADPHLGPLANNSGPTETEALQSGSQAIDAASDSLCSTETSNGTGPVDQRGVTRPQGPHCDIGAFEALAHGGGGGGGGKTATTVSTTVFDAGTHAAWAGTEAAGASAYDTTTLGGTVEGATPSGSVAYDLFGNGTCSGSPASTDTETLNPDGSVPRSKASGSLSAGSYSYQASYSGDANYAASTGPCEPFSVRPGQPDLSLTASPDSNPIFVGEQDTVTDTVKNVGGSSATDVNFTDPAAGFKINSVTPSQGTCTHTTTTVSCSLGTIGAGHSATVQILLTATSTGTITLHSSVSMAQTDPTPGNDHATTTIGVLAHTKPAADLAITVTPSADSVPVGRTLVYKLVVSNHGPDAGNEVSVTDQLPGQVKSISISAHAPTGCGATVGGTTTTTITCHLGTLPKFSTRKIRLLVRAEEPGLARDTARVTDASPTDPNLNNNHDQATVTISASALPSVGAIHLGAGCRSESSTIHIRGVAVAQGGIKQVSISVTGHGFGRGVAFAPPGGSTVQRQRFHLNIPASSLLAGRTYQVVVTVTDSLGHHTHAEKHFTVCNPPHKRGFTG